MGTSVVFADELNEKKSELSNITSQIENEKGKITKAQNQKNSVSQNIRDLEQVTNQTEQDIEYLENRILLTQQSIQVKQNEIDETEKELESQIDFLSNRLTTIYEIGEITYIEVLLSAESFTDFISQYDMVQSILEEDKKLIEEITIKKNKLEEDKDKLIKQRELLEKDKIQLESKKIELYAQREIKIDFLTNIKNEITAREQALRELEEEENVLRRMIASMQGETIDNIGTGEFLWPTPGYSQITSPFGMRFHPILKVNKLHSGMDIGAPSGAPIAATDSGQISYVGYQTGNGNTVIINHGNGMVTLYGHMSKFAVSNGQSVNRGDTIGYVGSTGWSTGPHLHFEIRVNGNPVNPAGYL